MNNRNSVIKCFFLVVLISVFAASCVSTPPSAPQAAVSTPAASSTGSASSTARVLTGEAASRQRFYMTHLRSEGLAPELDEDGDITFKRNGLNYFIIIGINDPTYISVMLPGIASISSASDRTRAANAVSFANSSSKVAKAYITGSSDQYVTLAVETYLENVNDFTVLFKRYLLSLDSIKEDFDSKY